MIIILSILLVTINNFNPTIINANSSDLGLVGYCNFDEDQGNVAQDLSGNNNNGIIHGASWTNGISGSALNFDGSNDWVEVQDDV